ncbi:DUF5947 family protein [Streptomyces triculaminicus]|uniref:DUF5947 family protein n=1 Tax=Streptomyces triculaminicus TaxID=2816232 RepID=UPI0033FA1890
MTAVPVAARRLRELARRPSPAPAPAAAAPERCDLCAEPVPAGHRHLLDLADGAALCSCRACALLFDHREAGGRHYRLLPTRRIRLAGHRIDDLLWAALGVPVGLAFFVRDGTSGRTAVSYPSPLGAVRSTVDPDVWAELASALPGSARPADDVEALLVNRALEPHEHWIVPLDDCYRLVAVVRAHWKGLTGGREAWSRIASFFAEPAPSAPAPDDPREAT